VINLFKQAFSDELGHDQYHGVKGIPMIERGADLGLLIVKVAEEQGVGVMDGDIIVVTQKVVSKAEWRLFKLEEIEPSELTR
jgi:coenzyme F420-0:L-glutamate ligase/coenzyme F420-1:gamma-L-glutamate ligase